jgi:hypothetical protein
MCPERARCIIIPIAPEPEPLPTEIELEEFEQELYLRHCLDGVERNMPTGSDLNPLLDMDWKTELR